MRESKSQESDDFTTVQKGKQSGASKNTSAVAVAAGGKQPVRENNRERANALSCGREDKSNTNNIVTESE